MTLITNVGFIVTSMDQEDDTVPLDYGRLW